MQTLSDVIFDMDVFDEFGWELENIKTMKLNGTEITVKYLNFVLQKGDTVEVETLAGKIYSEQIR
ncbi:hypothetical protein [Paenibacillus sp. CMAA1364]